MATPTFTDLSAATGTLPVSNGGTGSTSATTAAGTLGLGTSAIQSTGIAAFRVFNINCNNTGTTLIVPAIAGKRFIADVAPRIHISAVSGIGIAPTVSIGNDSGTSYINLVAAATLAVTTQYRDFLTALAANLLSLDMNSAGIYLNVSLASTYTTFVINVHVYGTYI